MKVRGHHLVCVYCFHGSRKATAGEFFGVDNAIPGLLARLRADPEIEIEVIADSDEVCDACPLRRPEGCGRSADVKAQSEKLRKWDRLILDRLGLAPGDKIRARELERIIRLRIPDIGEICANCSSASPSGWREFRDAIREGFWPASPASRQSL